MHHFWHIMLSYFKTGKNTTEMQKKKKFAVYGEGSEPDRSVKGGLQSFVLENCRWMMLQCWVDE